jgi:hypothetical protein
MLEIPNLNIFIYNLDYLSTDVLMIIIGTTTQRVLASFRSFLHSSRFMAVAHQLLNPSILVSFPTSSLHLARGLHTFLVLPVAHGVLVSVIFKTLLVKNKHEIKLVLRCHTAIIPIKTVVQI